MTNPDTSDYTPLEKLLKARPSEMTDAELSAFVNDMRAIRTTAATRRAAVAGKAPEASKVQQTIARFL